MRIYVYWFLAPESDAAAIRSIATTGARKREEWTHVALPGVDGPDMNKVEKLARPKRPKGSSKIGGQLLDKGKLTDEPFTCVSLVSPEFIQALVALDDTAATTLGRAVAETLDGVSEDAAVNLIRQTAEFARQSERTGQPVLELVVM